MYELLKINFEICLLKKGPQDIPYSPLLLKLLCLFYAVVRFLMLALHAETFNALLQIIVEIFLTLGFSWMILFVDGALNRFNQVSCALLGTDTLINFLALPGVMTLETGRGGLLVFAVLLGFVAWQCTVIAHIINHALDQKLLFSFGLAILYLLASYGIITFIFPDMADVQ